MIPGMSTIPQFRAKMKEMLIQLSKDRVVGVRAALAHSLKQIEKNKEWSLQFESIIALLSADKEECVRSELQ